MPVPEEERGHIPPTTVQASCSSGKWLHVRWKQRLPGRSLLFHCMLDGFRLNKKFSHMQWRSTLERCGGCLPDPPGGWCASAERKQAVWPCIQQGIRNATFTLFRAGIFAKNLCFTLEQWFQTFLALGPTFRYNHLLGALQDQK